MIYKRAQILNFFVHQFFLGWTDYEEKSLWEGLRLLLRIP